MDYDKKKMTAPIVITIIMILYYVIYFGFLITLLDGIWKYALGFIPIIFSIVMVKVWLGFIVSELLDKLPTIAPSRA